MSAGFDPARLDLLAHGLTVADIRDVHYPRWLATSLAELTGVGDPVATWTPAGGQQARTARWSTLGDGDLAAIYGQGAIALSDERDEVFSAGLRWYRLRRGGRAHAAEAPWLQNEVELRVDAALLSDEAFREAYVRWCCEAARELSATYLCAYSTLAYRVRLLHAEGLGAGLRDVYWLNVFGRELRDLIGADRLLSAPAARTERVGPDHVLVVLDDGVLEPSPDGDPRAPSPAARAVVEPVVDHIGREFFVRPRPEPSKPPVVGLLRGLRQLRGKGSAFDDPDVMAERRPTFDYSAMEGLG